MMYFALFEWQKSYPESELVSKCLWAASGTMTCTLHIARLSGDTIDICDQENCIQLVVKYFLSAYFKICHFIQS